MSLALRLQPVADGSDMMGSLRNPAAWANVFGLRPSQGRVPYNAHGGDCYVAQLGTEGPMGRSVRDVAMLLSVMAGHDARQPLSIAQDGSAFARPLQPRRRVACASAGWPTWAAYLPFEPGILPLCESALKRFEALGAMVEPLGFSYPCDEVWQTWLTWRRFLVAGNLAPFGADPSQHALLKPEAQWEYDQGQGLSGPQVYAASQDRTRFYRHMVSLFERFDLLVLPSRAGLALPGRMDLAARGRGPHDGHLPPLDGSGDLRHAGRAAGDERAGRLQRRRPADGHAADRTAAGRPGRVERRGRV